MQQVEQNTIPKQSISHKVSQTESEFDHEFKPTGAITFFVLLVLLGLVIWFGIYFLMLERV
jgi:hypothetical protein